MRTSSESSRLAATRRRGTGEDDRPGQAGSGEGSGIELVTMTSERTESAIRWMASPENTAWVAAARTSLAPCRMRWLTADISVPPVSIMSSTTRQRLPATSPTMSRTSAAAPPFPSGIRRLRMRARGASRCSEYFSATRTRPASGATTTTLSRWCSSTYSARIGSAVRWSTGMSKKPWICPECRSTDSTRSAPATCRRSAMRRAEMGSRARLLRSWRA